VANRFFNKTRKLFNILSSLFFTIVVESVFIASDQRGFFLKESMKRHFAKKIEFNDLGVHSIEPVFFPLIGVKLGKTISSEGGGKKGIVLCEKGIEMNAIINKFPGAKSAFIMDGRAAKIARERHDANVACMSIQNVNEMLAARIIEVFLKTEYIGNREK